MNELALNNPSSAFQHYCTFRLAGQLYGLEISAVREVSTCLVVTPVPHAPPQVRGLANLRSRIYLLLDLRSILGLASAEDTVDTRVVILKDGIAENIGVVVDAGGDIVSVTADRIEGTVSHAVSRSPDKVPAIVTAICKLEEELMMVVDPVRVTDHVKIMIS